MNITRQDLQLMIGYQVSQRENMGMMETYRKNHTYTDQSYVKYRSRKVVVKRVIKKKEYKSGNKQ